MLTRRMGLRAVSVGAFVLFWGSQGAFAEAVKYNLDTEKTELVWLGAKEVGDSHTGTIKAQSGFVSISGESITDAQIVIDMDSIVNTDVKNPEYNQKLVGHLKNDDFFNVEKFKTATFKMKSEAAKIADGNAELKGTLTIREKTNDFVIKLKSVKVEGDTATAEGQAVFDRSKFDVKYNSKSFPNLFKIAADKVIKNEIELTFKVFAAK